MMSRHNERGQTIVLVAVSLVSLLAMAALAIDVVTLYVGRSEIQRAADAVALAGAQAIADSGVTTLQPGDPNLPAAQTLAQSMATSAINAILTANPSVNQVAALQPALVGVPTVVYPATSNPPNSNPYITVTLNVPSVPTFFARIWGSRAVSVTSTATAEAYNPANVTNFTPIAPKGVKPWLVANSDPVRTPIQNFITLATGAVVPPGGAIGDTFNLMADCNAGSGCTMTDNPPKAFYNGGSNPQVEYLPAALLPPPGSPTQNVCPACAGATDYEQSIECADLTTSYTALSCGGGLSNVQWDQFVNPRGPTGLSAAGAECLIHASSAGAVVGQDFLTQPSPLFSAPMQIRAQSGPQNGNLVTTSNSVVTIPIIDNTNLLNPVGGPVTLVGFMQAFINGVQPGVNGGTNPGDINITVLNVAGCSATPAAANPVVGSSATSPVAVRLITPP